MILFKLKTIDFFYKTSCFSVIEKFYDKAHQNVHMIKSQKISSVLSTTFKLEVKVFQQCDARLASGCDVIHVQVEQRWEKHGLKNKTTIQYLFKKSWFLVLKNHAFLNKNRRFKKQKQKKPKFLVCFIIKYQVCI